LRRYLVFAVFALMPGAAVATTLSSEPPVLAAAHVPQSQREAQAAAQIRQPQLKVVPAGWSITLWMQGSHVLQVAALENGAVLSIRQEDRFRAAAVTLPDTGLVRIDRLYEGLPPRNVQRLDVTVVSGSLRYRAFRAGDDGRFLGAPEASKLRVLSVYGDSIGMGERTTGPLRDANGWADRLAARLGGYRLSENGRAGGGARCWGQFHTGRVTSEQPLVVIVAFGLIDTQTFGDCHATLAQFRSATDRILAALRSGVAPGVPIYVSAILPSRNLGEAERADYNDVLADEAGEHGCVYADPSPAIEFPDDFVRGIHPKATGHAKLARFWAATVEPPQP
jgi:lysophospholipase L1-like esterase